MKNQTRGRATVGRLTGVSLSGLLVAGVMLAAPPVQAADGAETVGSIAPNETAYAGWHQGADDATGRAGISSVGLQQVGQSQVIKGYDNNNAENLADDGVNANVSDLIGAEYDVVKGEAFFQLPMFIDHDGKKSTDGQFTTLRPVEGATGDTTIQATDMWVSSRAVGDIAANTPAALQDIVAAVNDRSYKTIGFGTFTAAGQLSTVKSINFNGTTYTFKAADKADATVKNADVLGTEAGNYTSWHQGYDNATARQYVTATGLELAGKSQVIKGYDNNSANLDEVNASLASALDDSSYTVESGADVSFQIPLRSDAVAGNQFATLYATVHGNGKHALADVTWQANKDIGSIAANNEKSIADFVAALGTYKVIGYGVLTSPGTSAVVSNVTFDGQSTDFKDVPATPASETVKTIAPNEDIYEGWHQGANGGVATIGANVLSMGATQSQVINGFADNNDGGLGATGGTNGDLATLLPGASYTVKSGAVHFQVPLFLQGDGSRTFMTLRPVAPAEVGANAISISDEWTSSKAIPGVIDANESASLGDILSALDNYKAIGFGVYTDTDGNGVVSDITWDGTKYDFASATPTVADVTGTTEQGDPVTVTLEGTDTDSDTLTYAATDGDNGTVTVAGDKATYTPAADFVGTDTFTYTANDGGSVSESATVTITVTATPVDAVPTVENVTGTTKQDTAVDVTLKGTDTDGHSLTYSASEAAHGTVTVAGNKATYKPATGYVGTDTFTYTANDGALNSAPGTVTITVTAKAKPKVNADTKFAIHPKAPTTKSKVYINITVVAKGATIKGTTVTVYDGSKKLGTAKLSSKNKATYKIGKLKKGTHKLSVKFPGTSTTNANTQVHSVKVK